MAEMVKEGFFRARVDGKLVDFDDPPELDRQKKHTIEVVVDRLVAKPARDEEYRRRLADSIETATRVSGGLVILSIADGPEEVLSANYACPDCGTSLTEITDPLLVGRREGGVPLALLLRGSRADDRAPIPRDREPRAPRRARGLHLYVGEVVKSLHREPENAARGAHRP
jgi:hypothetical protein